VSQFARSHPELFEQGIGYAEAHSDLADMDERREHCFTCGYTPTEPYGCGCDAPGADKEER
jgi:hypothetical protein